jgi:hypothetical protein
MFTGLQKRIPAKNGLLAEGQEESKGQSEEAVLMQGGKVTYQPDIQAIPAKKGNSSDQVEGQSAPALSNVPLGGVAADAAVAYGSPVLPAGGPSSLAADALPTLSVGGLSTSYVGGSACSAGGLNATGTYPAG